MIKREISKLKARMNEAGYYQVDVSLLTGIKEQRISDFVRKRRKPNKEEILKLAKILDCSREEILADLD